MNTRVSRRPRLADGAAGMAPFYLEGAGWRSLLSPVLFLVCRGRQFLSAPRAPETIDYPKILAALKSGETVTLAPLHRLPWRQLRLNAAGRAGASTLIDP